MKGATITHAVQTLPSREEIFGALDYDPETGIFRRKCGRGRVYAVGDVAGYETKKGYVVIKIGGRQHKAHVLAWVVMTRAAPVDQIDHVNLIKSDNRFSNLREANDSQNHANQKVRRDNSVGLKGVSRVHRSMRFKARIGPRGRVHLGVFDTAEEAHAVYIAAAADLYGEFARAV